jgi:hypothetical protein
MSYADAIAQMGKGRANPSTYAVVVPTLFTGETNNRTFNDYIAYYTRAVTLPASTNSVMSLKGHERLGVSRNVITGRSFGSPVVLTFTDRRDLIIYNTIKGWMDKSVLNSNQIPNRVDRGHLRAQYYNDITCDIEIFKLEPRRAKLDVFDYGYKDSLPTGKWTLHKCIPLSIEQTTLAIEAADSLLDFTFSIAYESFSYESFDESMFTGAFSSLADITNQPVNLINNPIAR